MATLTAMTGRTISGAVLTEAAAMRTAARNLRISAAVIALHGLTVSRATRRASAAAGHRQPWPLRSCCRHRASSLSKQLAVVPSQSESSPSGLRSVR
ncbi:hypothetical protein ABZP36_022924 [Zizania latifolia]